MISLTYFKKLIFESKKETGCLDIKECQIGSHKCDSKAQCIDTPGSYKCECIGEGRENHSSGIFTYFLRNNFFRLCSSAKFLRPTQILGP